MQIVDRLKNIYENILIFALQFWSQKVIDAKSHQWYWNITSTLIITKTGSSFNNRVDKIVCVAQSRGNEYWIHLGSKSANRRISTHLETICLFCGLREQFAKPFKWTLKICLILLFNLYLLSFQFPLQVI